MANVKFLYAHSDTYKYPHIHKRAKTARQPNLSETSKNAHFATQKKMNPMRNIRHVDPKTKIDNK